LTRSTSTFVLVLLLNGLTPRGASADAELIVESADAAGEGFEDPTPVDPVGGNTGETLGEQRLIAVQHAADLWGAAIDSEVAIVISATFADQGCASGGATTLASASAAGLQFGLDGDGADPALAYPDALANRLRGSDFAPDEPDILASFNAAIDDGCLPGTRWYYGLDADHRGDQDLVTVALHELGHGLGVQVFVDAATGQQTLGMPSAYSAHVLDLDRGELWSEMSDVERAASYANPRRVVWDGQNASEAAADWLRAGRPVLAVTPAVAGFSRLASDSSFGAPLSLSLSAPLVADASGCADGDVDGAIVLLRDDCAWSSAAADAAAAGAVGALLSWEAYWSSPPLPIDETVSAVVSIPVFAVSADDADALQAASQLDTLTVTMSLGSGLRGADAQGRVYLNATEPADTASSISHWDELARPHLLMEAIQKPVSRHQLDLTPAMLRDLGWAPLCGNGRLDQDEVCDEGDDNDDDAPNACRTSCERASCGDGTTDDDEDCDDGDDNSDSVPGACRSDCSEPACGDGVRDPGEACDDGDDNSDFAPDACRSDCSRARCGDGVVDRREACDEAEDNSNFAPDACRVDCSAARCGDGVVDRGEGCDEAEDLSDVRPGACRLDCQPARCGDGVVDDGEPCDAGDDNSDSRPDTCRTDCSAPRCGDGVVDDGELCDDRRTADCATACAASQDAGSAGMDDGQDDRGDHDADGGSGDGGGCGCRIAPQKPARGGLLLAALALTRLGRNGRRRGR
jgi:hypothetical protein